MHSLYVFILQFSHNSTCFERTFRSSSGVHDLLYLQLCTVLRLGPSNNRKTERLDTFARFVQSCRYSKLWTDDERNDRSKHVELYKNCRINTYGKCILSVCLYNWLRCAVHTMSKEIVVLQLLVWTLPQPQEFAFIVTCFDFWTSITVRSIVSLSDGTQSFLAVFWRENGKHTRWFGVLSGLITLL